jgi:hypothetical protein
MKKSVEFIPRSRAFLVGCLVYTLAVVVTFLVGLTFASKNSDGWTFLPCVLLTLPWWQILAMLPTPQWLFAALTAFYDLPLFALSALLNLAVVGGIRSLLRRS